MLILFVYSCSCSSVLLLSFKLLHSGNPKKHTQPKICGYISEASKIVCPFWQVWGLGFSAWQHRVESWQVFALKRQSVNQYKSVLFYLYVLDRHFEWLSLSFVLSNIPSPRTDLASGEHWPAITDHGVIRDLKIHENDWTNLNQKKSPGKSGNVFSASCSSVGNVILSSSPIPLYRQLPTEESHHRIVTVPFSSLCWCGHTILVTEMIQNCSFCSHRVETILRQSHLQSGSNRPVLFRFDRFVTGKRCRSSWFWSVIDGLDRIQKCLDYPGLSWVIECL